MGALGRIRASIAAGLDRLAAALSTFAAWLLFLIGAMLTYEVVARYFFTAPTIWAEELSRLFLIWAVFVASASLIKSRHHIRVSVVIDHAPPGLRRLADIFSLLFVAVIAGVVAFNGAPIAAQSFEVGRTTGSMLDIPSWWMQASIPVGFGLIAAQAIVEALRAATQMPEVK
ncbi:MAG: TRAP transporter small permease [Pseudomonadota bacterium]